MNLQDMNFLFPRQFDPQNKSKKLIYSKLKLNTYFLLAHSLFILLLKYSRFSFFLSRQIFNIYSEQQFQIMLPQKIVLKLNQSQKSSWNIDKTTPMQKSFDLFIYVKDHLIPVQKSKVQDCKILHDEPYKNKKIIHIVQNLEIPMFSQVMSYFHGSRLQLTTMKQLSAFLDVVDFLRTQTLTVLIQQHILKNIQSYQIFELLELAQNFCLQLVFNTCLDYLKLDQFQQIKYNKFGFLQCNFELFQIIIRRHHFLKLRKQIQGLKVNDIEQVIRVYCRRYKFQQSILNRLLTKYVHSVKQPEENNHELKLLHKLPFKNILQSANLDIELKQLQFDSVLRRTSIEEHKSYKKQLIDSFSEEDQSMSEQKVKYIQKIIVSKPIKNQEAENKKKNTKRNELQSEIMVTKISGLLNQYQEALNIHDAKLHDLQNMKRAKSELLDSQNQQQNKQMHKLPEYPNLLYTVYLPTK